MSRFGRNQGSKPGHPAMRGRDPHFTQRHYEHLAEMFRSALRKFPGGAPEHIGVCFMMLHCLQTLKEDNPKFQEFLFIEWANTP